MILPKLGDILAYERDIEIQYYLVVDTKKIGPLSGKPVYTLRSLTTDWEQVYGPSIFRSPRWKIVA